MFIPLGRNIVIIEAKWCMVDLVSTLAWSHVVAYVFLQSRHGAGAIAMGANFQEVTYFLNVDEQAHPIAIPALASRNFVLHPVHPAAGAADARAAQATYDAATGTFTIPPRTAVVFVVPQ